MKTNKILAVGKDATLELEFQKPLDYPEEVLLRICQKHYPSEGITKVCDGNNHHICKFCGGVAKGIDEDILCEKCRELFGHAFFSEL